MSKNTGGSAAQSVIEVPSQPSSTPEVYFVNYNEGENPQLLDGIDLNTALSQAAQPGQAIGGAPGGAGFGVPLSQAGQAPIGGSAALSPAVLPAGGSGGFSQPAGLYETPQG